jgi:hypothetical protein
LLTYAKYRHFSFFPFFFLQFFSYFYFYYRHNGKDDGDKTQGKDGKGKSNKKYLEVLFDPVPNLDEVAFGTAWNQRFRKEVGAFLNVPDVATNRGGAVWKIFLSVQIYYYC